MTAEPALPLGDSPPTSIDFVQLWLHLLPIRPRWANAGTTVQMRAARARDDGCDRLRVALARATTTWIDSNVDPCGPDAEVVLVVVADERQTQPFRVRVALFDQGWLVDGVEQIGSLDEL